MSHDPDKGWALQRGRMAFDQSRGNRDPPSEWTGSYRCDRRLRHDIFAHPWTLLLIGRLQCESQHVLGPQRQILLTRAVSPGVLCSALQCHPGYPLHLTTLAKLRVYSVSSTWYDLSISLFSSVPCFPVHFLNQKEGKTEFMKLRNNLQAGRNARLITWSCSQLLFTENHVQG